MSPIKGSCNCGLVRFTLFRWPTDAIACHCTLCRKQSGHFFAGANIAKADLEVEGAEHLTWYHASDRARRAFCSRCGSWLFWEPVEKDWTSVALGGLEGRTGLRLERHIFVADKGDYYTIDDGLPQNPNEPD